MSDLGQTLWFQTFLALAGLCAGLFFHLRWHPLRSQLSDGWDMLLSLKWLVPLLAALQLFSTSFHEGPEFGLEDAGQTLTGQMLARVPQAALADVQLLHALAPPWPLALAVPFWLSLLFWRVKRFPYRYVSKRRLSSAWRWLALVAVLGWLWLGLEAVALLKPVPEGLETVRLMLRWLSQSLALAASQIFMIRLVIGWDEPEKPEDEDDAGLAFEQLLVRWPGVMALAGLDLLWLLAWHSLAEGHAGWAKWLLVEAGLLFASIPVVAARLRCNWRLQAEAAVRVLLNCAGSLLGLFLTGTALLLLVQFAMGNLQNWADGNVTLSALFRILSALVLATVRSWLFLTFVLTVLRHGFKAAASPEGGRSDMP
ncbi:MAG TPA: hypothetical protein VGE29_19305 [Prosthecobacter sp.]